MVTKFNWQVAQEDAVKASSTAPSSRFTASLIFDLTRKVLLFACHLLYFILLFHHRKQTNSWQKRTFESRTHSFKSTSSLVSFRAKYILIFGKTRSHFLPLLSPSFRHDFHHHRQESCSFPEMLTSPHVGHHFFSFSTTLTQSSGM